MFIHAGKSAEGSVAPTNQIVAAEVSHAPDVVELEDAERWLTQDVSLTLILLKRSRNVQYCGTAVLTSTSWPRGNPQYGWR